MGHNGFRINFDGMEDVLAQFRQSTQMIDESINHLITKGDAQAASWDGVTFEQYNAAKQNWKASAAELHRKMALISTKAQACQTDIGDTEAQNLSIVKML